MIKLKIMRKPEEYKKVIKLRSKGFSYKEILGQVSIGHGTVSRWSQGVVLTKKQKERLLKKRNENPFIVGLRKQANKREKIAERWATGKINQILDGNKNKNLLLISGILFYWAEGTKSKVRKTIEFVNTDYRIIKIIIRFFRETLGIPKGKIKIMVRIGSKGDLEKAINYWSKITGILRTKFQKPEIINLKENSKSLERYPFGMCRVTIHDNLSYRKLLFLIEKFSGSI